MTVPVRGRSLLEGQPLVLVQRRHLQEVVRRAIDTSDLAEKRVPQRLAMCIKSGSPMILMYVASAFFR
jgi:hypothetical protein